MEYKVENQKLVNIKQDFELINNKKSDNTTNKKHSEDIPYSQEVIRKTVHLVSLSIPIIYIYVDQKLALFILLPMALIAVTLDVLSKKQGSLSEKIIIGLFGKMLRKHELNNKEVLLNGASWVLISAFLTVLVFPKIIAVVAFIILIISDISAALIGRKWGKTKLGTKSLEGTLAFMISGFLVVLVIGYFFNGDLIYYLAGFFGSIVGGFAELYAKELKLDDNLSIPIGVGITMLFFATLINNSFLQMMN